MVFDIFDFLIGVYLFILYIFMNIKNNFIIIIISIYIEMDGLLLEIIFMILFINYKMF